jgi:hypothetical protein
MDKSENSEKKQDDIVKKLRPDPSKPPIDTIILDGFEGNSDRKGFRRLYVSNRLDKYYTIAEEDIVTRVESANGGTRIYVKANSKPEYTVTVSLGEYVKGPITEEFLKQAAMGKVGGILEGTRQINITFWGNTCNGTKSCKGWWTCKYGLTLSGCTCITYCDDWIPCGLDTDWHPTVASRNCPCDSNDNSCPLA